MKVINDTTNTEIWTYVYMSTNARGGGTAHTWYNVVTDAVFHAPMSALNADADWNACEPATLGPQRCIVSIRS
jgi:hypothetical protein